MMTKGGRASEQSRDEALSTNPVPAIEPASAGAENQARRSLALAALLLGACAIALAPILVRISELPPVATAFYRLALAAPLLVIAVSWQPSASTKSGRSGLGWVILAGLFFAGDLGFWHLSITYTSVANATLFANFSPIVVTLVAWLFLGERVGLPYLLGMILAIGGAALLIRSSQQLSPDHLLGDLLGLLTALFYAGYLLTTKLARQYWGTLPVMAGSTTIGALALLPFVFGFEGLPVAQTLSGWLVLAALALFAHVGGQGLIAYAMAHLTASFSALALLLQPAVAAALAWWLFGEVLGAIQIAGAMAILTGIVIAQRQPQA